MVKEQEDNPELQRQKSRINFVIPEKSLLSLAWNSIGRPAYHTLQKPEEREDAVESTAKLFLEKVV